jgi:hypothetical protein
MNLEITINETITVIDILEPVIRLFKRIASFIKPVDEEADEPETKDGEDNKSPPVNQTPSAEPSEAQNPPDLGISVSDATNAGESFGP